MKIKGILIIVLLVTLHTYSQNEDNKWVIGIGLNAIDFYPTGEPESLTGNPNGFGNELFNVNDHWNKYGFPKLQVTRHLWKKFAFDVAFSMNNIEIIGENTIPKVSYMSLDGSVQYSILKDNTKFYPYVLLGGGYTWIDEKGAGTFNSGIGLTYWFTDVVGLNGVAIYKYSPEDYPNVPQHIYYSASVVFRLGSGRRGCPKGL